MPKSTVVFAPVDGTLDNDRSSHTALPFFGTVSCWALRILRDRKGLFQIVFGYSKQFRSYLEPSTLSSTPLPFSHVRAMFRIRNRTCQIVRESAEPLGYSASLPDSDAGVSLSLLNVVPLTGSCKGWELIEFVYEVLKSLQREFNIFSTLATQILGGQIPSFSQKLLETMRPVIGRDNGFFQSLKACPVASPVQAVPSVGDRCALFDTTRKTNILDLTPERKLVRVTWVGGG